MQPEKPTVSAARRRRRQRAAARHNGVAHGGVCPAVSPASARPNTGLGRWRNSPRTAGPVGVDEPAGDSPPPPAYPNMLGKIAFANYGAQLRLPHTEPEALTTFKIKTEPGIDHAPRLPNLTEARYGKPYRLMEHELTDFGALGRLTSFVEGFDEFMNPNGTDIVAVPYDAINNVPETTFRHLERFRWWGAQKYGPRCARLSPETRKRNGRELRAHFNKKFVGDGDQLVELTEEFKLKRCQEIQRVHAETSLIPFLSNT